MGKITIKTLPANDWERYKHIRLEALKTNPLAFSTTYEEAKEWVDEKWQEELEQSEQKNGTFYLFAFDDDKVIGMNGFYWRERPTTGHHAEVFGVFVQPAYRGQGIGRQLMEAIFTEIKKDPRFKKIKLGVNAENIPALKLYQKCGLQIIGKLEKELKFGDNYYDELLMEMIIK